MERRPAPRPVPIRGVELAAAVGSAVFVGVGIAIGLALGSTFADVPVDRRMLELLGGAAAAVALIVRVVQLLWRARPGRSPAPRRPA